MAKAPTGKTFNGSSGNDSISGTAYADIINGNGGNDTITGNGGADTITGGAGADVFRYLTYADSRAAGGIDTITDFNSALDRVDLTAFGGATLVSAWQAGGGRQATLGFDGSRTTLSIFDGSSTPVFQLYLTGDHRTLAGIQGISYPPPTITVSDASVDEAAGTVTFTVTRSGAAVASSASSVSFATADGTAIAGADYTAASGLLNFAAGETVKTIVVSIANDKLMESTESFSVQLTAVTNANVTDSTGLATILDNDRPTESPDDLIGTAGDDIVDLLGGNDRFSGLGGNDRVAGGAGEDVVSGDDGDDTITGNGGADTITGGSGADAFRYLAYADSRASDGIDTITDFNDALDSLDLTAFGGATLVSAWQAGAGRQATLSFDGSRTTLSIFDGSSTPVFQLYLTGDHRTLAGIQGISYPPPTITVSDASVDEAAGTLTFTVTRSGPGVASSASSLAFATADGTAIAGADYTAASGVLDFAAGETVKTITVAIANDKLMESTEGFSVTLTAVTNADVADSSGMATILDNDRVTQGSDDLIGTAGDDIVNLLGGNDRFSALAGNDRVDGGAGDDIIYGGDGDDILIGGTGYNTLYGEGGRDRFILWENSSLSFSHNNIYGGADIDTVDTSLAAYAMRFEWLPEPYHLHTRISQAGLTVGAAVGVEHWIGSGGDDFFSFAGLGDDLTIEGGAGHDEIGGGNGNDVLIGGDGDDRLLGNGGSNILAGGAGDDFLRTGLGFDSVTGGEGFDTVDLGWMANGVSVVGFENGDFEVRMGGVLTASATGVERVLGSYRDDELNFTFTTVPMTLEGGNDDDYIVGGTAADTLSGDAGNDVLDGGAGANLIFGGGGDDRLIIANVTDGSMDTMDGGTEHDVIDASDSTMALRLDGHGFMIDVWTLPDWSIVASVAYAEGVIGSGHDDEIDLYAMISELFLDGGGGDDFVAGGLADDLVQGGAGDDLLRGSEGEDVLDGGDGHDRVWLGFSQFGPVDITFQENSAAEPWIITHDEGTDTVINVEAMLFYGSQFDDRITGGAGDDWMDGQDGDDLLAGGEGDDELFGNWGSDTLSGGEGNDVLEGMGMGADLIFGDGGDDRLVLTDVTDGATDILNGGSGHDVIDARDSWRALYFDSGFGGSEVTILEKEDWTTVAVAVEIEGIIGSAYDDQIYVYTMTGAMILDGGGGDDIIVAGLGNDLVYGGAGDDWLRGWGSADLLDGGDGHDMIAVSFGHSQVGVDFTFQENSSGTPWIVSSWEGTHTVINVEAVSFGGSPFADRVTGGAGDDQFEGGDGDDRLVGGAGDDRLFGYDGADVLHGGLGADLLDAGGDHHVDLFVYTSLAESNAVFGIDTLYAYSGDRIDLSQIDIDSTTPEVETADWIFVGEEHRPDVDAAQATMHYDVAQQATVLRLFLNDGDSVADFELLISGEPVDQTMLIGVWPLGDGWMP